jgi:hypothetical protein
MGARPCYWLLLSLILRLTPMCSVEKRKWWRLSMASPEEKANGAIITSQWDLTSEDVEGVAVINSKGRLEIFSQGERSKWEKQPTYLHVGPLLMLDGVRQPLDSKTWYGKSFFFFFRLWYAPSFFIIIVS